MYLYVGMYIYIYIDTLFTTTRDKNTAPQSSSSAVDSLSVNMIPELPGRIPIPCSSRICRVEFPRRGSGSCARAVGPWGNPKPMTDPYVMYAILMVSHLPSIYPKC